MTNKTITIVGAGLAGSEAALQLAERGWEVSLYEMRPERMTPAHQTDKCAELVCSNSLKSLRTDTAAGLLKEELKLLNCKLLQIALDKAVPAGHALAVDRDAFAEEVTRQIEANSNITLIREEITAIPKDPTILAGGPLTSDALMQAMIEQLGEQHLYFFDAIAPIVSADSLDRSVVFEKSRYNKGDADYLNCPFTKEEYLDFVSALLEGEKHTAHEFENAFFKDLNFRFYENCMPIEELARRGTETLRFGVMRPVGLEDARTGKRAYAVLQLRAENRNRTAFNLVGCQTMLKYGAQKEIFRKIPGLNGAEFLRYGSIHRNSYLNSPALLQPNLALKALPDVWLAGQFCGVEGYTESIGMGLLVALIIDSEFDKGKDSGFYLPETTVLGQLWKRLITASEQRFQPVNANFGLLPELIGVDKKNKKQEYAIRAFNDLQNWIKASI
ncbi:MAG: methylenetetrahydrofolate--tRNA-(uracil(54)-C(5))-methyltransferase (FADH(2)-oxidizing) TrmFO [Candidatus Cloacimonetes bacterium]|nr:methylenetetrahydrofolate--tRNA-(uracil(54)-C(5))-methyltransferase (FADH(2)-oxidizing) TrmFO [Candidatus Cloacimonadota bacterium]